MKFESPTSRLLDHLTTAVMIFDGQLCLRYLNAAAEMLFATSRRKALYHAVDGLLPDVQVLRGVFQRALDSGHPFTEHELSLRIADGHLIVVDITVSPLDDPGSARELLVEMVRVDRHLRITREEAQLAQHQATRAVVRGLAHEIKNPLGGLRGTAQLLERELVDESLKEFTRIIIGEADRLRNLVNRLLGPNALPKKKLMNVHEVLERVLAIIQGEGHHGIHLVRDYDPSLPHFLADAEQLIQAVLNIVRNAVQAINEAGGDGGGTGSDVPSYGTIILRTRVQRQIIIGQQRYRLAARISVIDSGPGIPAALLDNVFYPMVTTRAEGTGLGLSIAQSIVHLHDGLIECASQPGRTLFTLLLPMEKAHE